MSDALIVSVIGLAILGAFSGLITGMLGLGGGLLVPFMTAGLLAWSHDFDLAVKMAIATSMAAFFLISFLSVKAHHDRGGVRWAVVFKFTPGVIIGSLLSSLGAFTWFSGKSLAIFVATFYVVIALYMMFGRASNPSRSVPGRVGLIFAGVIIGFISGLIGGNGAVMSVPFLVWSNVAMGSAVATSTAIGLIVASVSLGGYLISGLSVQNLPYGSLGYIWLPGVALLTITSSMMIPLGVRLAFELQTTRLRRAFSLVIFILGLYMLYKGLNSE